MTLRSISLQNFRNYKKQSFNFSQGITLILGPNTSGKTNLIEAIFLLSRGKSFRAEKDTEMIRFNQELARIRGKIDGKEEKELEVMLTTGNVGGVEAPLKKFMVNGVSKRRVDFAGLLPTVLFSPVDLDMIVGSPSLRRNFLDDVLEQIDKAYSLSLAAYAKALRQRNALLDRARETGIRIEKQFEYWDKLLIEHGKLITQKREEFINFINSTHKDVFDCVLSYDKSIVSKDRLLQYKDAEAGAGVTLVGPHRDDFSVFMFNNSRQATHDISLFGSRGQQRLVVLQLKLLQLSFVDKSLGERPVLLLDDIFSELDDARIHLVSETLVNYQTVLTTTHREFINKKLLKDASVVELG